MGDVMEKKRIYEIAKEEAPGLLSSCSACSARACP